MQSAKQKLGDMASAAKEHIVICKAKAEEKAEKVTARTAEEKAVASERKKAKEAKAKMELHEAKAEHAAQKFSAKQSHLFDRHPAVTHVDQHGHNNNTTSSTTGTTRVPIPKHTVPAYPYATRKFP